MTDTPDSWGWVLASGSLAFCLTFTHQLAPSAVLERYGADPQTTRTMDGQTAHAAIPTGRNHSLLRAGRLGNWAFCFETYGVQGLMPDTLTELSADTETLAVNFAEDATHTFEHWADSRRIESFEPGMPYDAPSPTTPHTFRNLVEQREAATPGQLPILAALEGLSDHIGGHTLTPDTLGGPLLTALLPLRPRASAHTPSTSPAEVRKHLGKFLGTLPPATS
ncbi:DUF6461 domain-containing protein [Streptomyces sp. S186]|uniref:DUF6461 domain-containing protein n=1 Tax=Streptomyces sp. S186 TaxID=3434395 RepID=UPI003F66DB44